MKYKICVAGAAKTGHCSKNVRSLAEELGKEIVRQNGILITGATDGIPYWSAIGAKSQGGISVGISPASSQKDHKERYKLPTDYFDIIIYSGAGYSARNIWLMRATDAVIFMCGRMGTLNEFTICFEDERLIGVLEGTGGTADMIRTVVKIARKGPGKIIYGKDPKRIVSRLIKLIDQEKKKG